MSDNTKYVSKYSNGKEVTAAQYITELICENKAKINKQDLHYKFWTHKNWARYYRNQIASANKLVLRYDPKAIIKAIKDPAASRIYSLRAPHLLPIIEKHQQAITEENKNFTLSVNREINKSFRSQYNTKNQKSIISKIKDIDNNDNNN